MVKELNWKYCECGCHQHKLTIAGKHFTNYDDLKGGMWMAEGHDARYQYPKNKVKNWEEGDQKIKQILKAMAQELKRVGID